MFSYIYYIFASLQKRELRDAKCTFQNSRKRKAYEANGINMLITSETWVFIFLIIMKVIISISTL